MGSRQYTALRGVSVTFHSGEFTAIVGPSGSGKSTILNMIRGIDRPTSGEVIVGTGTDLFASVRTRWPAGAGRMSASSFSFSSSCPR